MKIAVLNGSPKAEELSVTMHYIKYIQKKFPQHEFKIFHISRNINEIERINDKFISIIDGIKEADGVIWAFPVYIFLVPSQLKRFIEILLERNITDMLKDKYTVAISTSIHFYDHTAHEYIQAICDDLNMNFVGFFSADMYDLLKPEERSRLRHFVEHFFEAISQKIFTTKKFDPISYNSIRYHSIDSKRNKIDVAQKKIIILTDGHDKNSNLYRMLHRFQEFINDKAEMINLNDVDIKGGCLGCLRCTINNNCIYNGKDEFTQFYDTKLRKADIIIFGASIKDRYLSAQWKLFFDRTFFHNHVPTLIEKQIGFIISGPLNQIPNIRQILEAHMSLHQSNVIDFVTDESGNSESIDSMLYSLAYRAVRFAKIGYYKSSTFLNIAGMKIFRDDVWGRLRFVLQADHRYYKQHGFYDYPHRNLKTRAINLLLMLLTHNQTFQKRFSEKMTLEMVKPLQRVISSGSL